MILRSSGSVRPKRARWRAGRSPAGTSPPCARGGRSARAARAPHVGQRIGALVAHGTQEQVAAKADTSYAGSSLAEIVKPAGRRKRRGARAKVPAAARGLPGLGTAALQVIHQVFDSPIGPGLGRRAGAAPSSQAPEQDALRRTRPVLASR